MDLGTLNALLSSVKTATDIAKTLKDSDLSLDKAETKLKLAELIGALADTKIQVAELQEELIASNRRIQEMEETQRINEHEMQWDGTVYWREVNSDRDGPYCPQCYDSSNHLKLIRLQTVEANHWSCRTCKSSYYAKNHSSPGLSSRAIVRSRGRF